MLFKLYNTTDEDFFGTILSVQDLTHLILNTLQELLTIGQEHTVKNTHTTNVPENVNKSLAFLLELEVLLGLETPKDYQQERMQYQVGRLSEQMLMASEEQQSDEEKILQKIQEWYALEKIGGDVGVMIQERFLPIQTWLENQLK